MRVTGYEMMDRLEALRGLVKTAETQFQQALYRFPSATEETPDPRELMRVYLENEEKIARLQEAQALYNTQVKVTVLGETMTLQRAIKLQGSVGHVKSAWEKAAGSQTHNPYYSVLQRDKDSEYAERVVSVEECLQRKEEAATRALALKQAIRAGNATALELDIEEGLFA